MVQAAAFLYWICVAPAVEDSQKAVVKAQAGKVGVQLLQPLSQWVRLPVSPYLQLDSLQPAKFRLYVTVQDGGWCHGQTLGGRLLAAS